MPKIKKRLALLEMVGAPLYSRQPLGSGDGNTEPTANLKNVVQESCRFTAEPLLFAV